MNCFVSYLTEHRVTLDMDRSFLQVKFRDHNSYIVSTAPASIFASRNNLKFENGTL